MKQIANLVSIFVCSVCSGSGRRSKMCAKLQLNGYDITRGAFAKIESGTRHIYLDDLLALQKVLNISFDELMMF